MMIPLQSYHKSASCLFLSGKPLAYWHCVSIIDGESLYKHSRYRERGAMLDTDYDVLSMRQMNEGNLH